MFKLNLVPVPDKHRHYRHVPKRLCPETAISRNGYVPKRLCPEVAMSRNGHVPKQLCPETVMSRSGYVPNRLCPEVAMSRISYVPKWLCPETSGAPLKEYSSLQDNPYNVRFIHTGLIVHNYFAPRGVVNVLISESNYCTACALIAPGGCHDGSHLSVTSQVPGSWG